VYGIGPQIVLISVASVAQIFATKAGRLRVEKQTIESVFHLWGLFDTPKNRVVTSEVIFGSFFSE